MLLPVERRTWPRVLDDLTANWLPFPPEAKTVTPSTSASIVQSTPFCVEDMPAPPTMFREPGPANCANTKLSVPRSALPTGEVRTQPVPL